MSHPPAPVPARGRSWSAWGGFLAKLAFSAACLGWVAHRVDPAALWRSLQDASPAWLAFGFLLFLLAIPAGGLRWWVALRALGQRVALGRLTGLFWIVTAMSQFLPAVAGDAARVWLGARAGLPLSAALNSTVLERVAMLLVLVLIVAAATPLSARFVMPPAGSGGIQPLTWAVPLALAGLAGVAVLARADAALRRLPVNARLAGPARHVVAALSALSADTRRLAWSPWTLPMLALCLVGHLNFVAAAWALGRGLGLGLPAPAYLAFIPLVIAVTILPISVGGWGLREGLLVGLMTRAGVPAETALAFSLLFGATSTAASLPGLVLWWRAAPSRA